MPYADTAALSVDGPFIDRVNVCAFQEATKFADDARPEFVALATDVITTNTPGALVRAVCNSPGFDTKYADAGRDQTAITDGDLLSATDTVWPEVAAMLHPDLVGGA